jgi:hypothetical protein
MTRPTLLLRSAAFAAGLLAGLPAAANRPLNTETADIVPRGEVQFETFAARERSTGSPNATTWTVQAGIGVGLSTQINLGHARSRSAGETASSLALGGKTSLIDLGETSPGLALAYGIDRVRLPGMSWQSDTRFVSLAGTLPVGDALLLHANLGSSHSSIDRSRSTTWGLGAEWSLPRRLVLFAEAFGDDRDKPVLGAGLLWKLSDRFSLNMSYGVATERPRVRQWTAGLEFDF